MDYPAAHAVAMVVRNGSFEKAARAMGVTPSAVSQRVRQMEERLGVVLVERGTPCRATEKGAWLCRHIEQVGILEKDLMDHLPGLESASGFHRATLNVATSADSLGTWFIEAIARFAEESDYLFNIAVDDQDHTTDWLRRGQVIAAVTSMRDPVQGCRVTELGTLRYLATASTAFVARHFPGGVTDEALVQAPALTFNQKDGLQDQWIKRAFGAGISHPTHWLPSTHGFVDAALAGLGWGLNPIHLVREHLASGRLVELVPGVVLDVPLFWQVNRMAGDRLTGLTKSIVTTARRELMPGN